MTTQTTISVIENNDFVERFQLMLDGEPLLLSDYTIEAFLRESRLVEDEDSTLLEENSGILIVDVAEGIIEVVTDWETIQPMKHLRIDAISALNHRRTHVIAYLNHVNT